MTCSSILLVLLAVSSTSIALPPLLEPEIVTPIPTLLRTSGESSLFRLNLPAELASYPDAPFLVKLVGSRDQVGFDYATLLGNETQILYASFMEVLVPDASGRAILDQFLDWLWDRFLLPHVPAQFQAELAGMKRWDDAHGDAKTTPVHLITQRFDTLANLPADGVNVIRMLEDELEEDWPIWLRISINTLIAILERVVRGCDAFGVWGSRTENGLLYSSRNLDWNKDTGISRFKLVAVMMITDRDTQGQAVQVPAYTMLGFANGLGALAGMSERGITTSEMNLDNSEVTFNGMPFPIRLRHVLEQAHDIPTALAVWDATNNTNSFNFLIASAADANGGGPGIANANGGAVALETIKGYTAVFHANEDTEREAVFWCPAEEGSKSDPRHCHSWTNETGMVKIGQPLEEAVWRSNHGMGPRIMLTQENLFNNTVFRYNLMHDLFARIEDQKRVVDDTAAVGIAAVLGIKGPDFFSCNQDFSRGDNILSVVYAPGPRAGGASPAGRLYVSWEDGTGSGWRPAPCNPYLRIDLHDWIK